VAGPSELTRAAGPHAPAIQVRKLVKAFGHQVALRGVDLDVAGGEFLALFGPNGAGKTTLMRVIASLARPTAGAVSVRGEDVGQAATSLRRHLGLISHNPLLYGDLTPDENLRFFARMYDLPDPGRRIDELLEQVGLSNRRRDPVRTFSRGMVRLRGRSCTTRRSCCWMSPTPGSICRPPTCCAASCSSSPPRTAPSS
jgi:heme exporter protein A